MLTDPHKLKMIVDLAKREYKTQERGAVFFEFEDSLKDLDKISLKYKSLTDLFKIGIPDSDFQLELLKNMDEYNPKTQFVFYVYNPDTRLGLINTFPLSIKTEIFKKYTTSL